MDDDLKALFGTALVIAFVVFILLITANWRWRLNRRDMIQRDVEYIKAGYVQKAVPTDFEIVWVKDANSN